MIVKIDTYFDGEYWCARGLSEDIFTQGETYDELLKNIREAVSLHFEDVISKGGTLEILVMSEMEVSGVA
ncbi:MAG TPA: type II toxin-antitoxin system HicB family antitoxin [Nitrospirae bacterium]|nr:type II toxin-antitoxin system HicB family antitoxin [Nitrospirota bacterium]